ncbi:MAG: ABC transporter permease [Steroidobacteraceae bacterium]
MNFNTLRQLGAITAMNLRNVPSRLSSSLVAAVGVAGVVAILIGVLSMAEGFRGVLQYAGRDDVAIVLRGGSNDEMSSGLSLEQTRLIADAPQVARGADGPLASPELYVIIDAPMRVTGTSANVPLRGVEGHAPLLRRDFRIIAGRMFKPGTFEVIVGQGAARQFRGLTTGATVRWGSTDWYVAGVFADRGSVAQGEVWTDATVLQNAYNRGSSFQSVRVQLRSAAALGEFARTLKADPRLTVRALSERAFYQEQSRIITTMIESVGSVIAILMGLGAVFAALNTMYSTVAARTREIATLRALGFGALPVVTSVLTESMLLGLAGGLLGCLAAWLGFNGIETSTMNWASFSQITFAFKVTPALMARGLSYGLLLALLGGLLPAIRAARQSVVAGLRAA